MILIFLPVELRRPRLPSASNSPRSLSLLRLLTILLCGFRLFGRCTLRLGELALLIYSSKPAPTTMLLCVFIGKGNCTSGEPMDGKRILLVFRDTSS